MKTLLSLSARPILASIHMTEVEFQSFLMVLLCLVVLSSPNPVLNILTEPLSLELELNISI